MTVKRFLSLLLLISVLLFKAGSTALAQTSSPQALKMGQRADTDEAAIRTILATYEEAWNRHDARAFSLIFAPNAEFTNVRGVVYHGRAGIEKAHAPLFGTQFAQSHQQTTAVRMRFLRPDLAAVDVRWTMTGALNRQGSPRPKVQGLRNMILMKRRKAWSIVIFHNMEIAPLPGDFEKKLDNKAFPPYNKRSGDSEPDMIGPAR